MVEATKREAILKGRKNLVPCWKKERKKDAWYVVHWHWHHTHYQNANDQQSLVGFWSPQHNYKCIGLSIKQSVRIGQENFWKLFRPPGGKLAQTDLHLASTRHVHVDQIVSH